MQLTPGPCQPGPHTDCELTTVHVAPVQHAPAQIPVGEHVVPSPSREPPAEAQLAVVATEQAPADVQQAPKHAPRPQVVPQPRNTVPPEHTAGREMREQEPETLQHAPTQGLAGEHAVPNPSHEPAQPASVVIVQPIEPGKQQAPAHGRGLQVVNAPCQTPAQLGDVAKEHAAPMQQAPVGNGHGLGWHTV